MADFSVDTNIHGGPIGPVTGSVLADVTSQLSAGELAVDYAADLIALGNRSSCNHIARGARCRPKGHRGEERSRKGARRTRTSPERAMSSPSPMRSVTASLAMTTRQPMMAGLDGVSLSGVFSAGKRYACSVEVSGGDEARIDVTIDVSA